MFSPHALSSTVSHERVLNWGLVKVSVKLELYDGLINV